jgi:lantibiotic modifying enzyme
MHECFSDFRIAFQSRLQRRLKTRGDRALKSYYNKFLLSLQEGGLCRYLKEHAVLGRLMATKIELWVEAISEMIYRIEKDELCIRTHLNGGRDLGKVIAVRPSLSDPHHRGRSVMILQFESGLHVVYKPKPIGIEKIFNELLQWLNQKGSPIPLRSFEVLDYDSYGWAEFITTTPIENKEEGQLYFSRMGALLVYCMYWVLLICTLKM